MSRHLSNCLQSYIIRKQSGCGVNSLWKNNSCYSCHCLSKASNCFVQRRVDNKSCQRAHHLWTRRNYSDFSKYTNKMDVPAGLFHGLLDRFNGITVDSKTEHDASVNFGDKLQKSLDFWITNKKRGIWFKVRTEHADWVPQLIQQGFDFHHAKAGYVMLSRWLPKDETANLPEFAHTMLGVGGLVVNDKNEILVVSERFALIPNSWKLPGGYVDPGENIITAAIREVREETGIETEFLTSIALRHSHGGCYGLSDIYFVIGLKPKNTNLVRCEREIAKVAWMPIAEYLEHPHVHQTNRQFGRIYLDYLKRGQVFAAEKGLHQILKKEYWLYYCQSLEEYEKLQNQPALQTIPEKAS